MRKLIFQMLISLDGYYEGLGHEIDWHVVDDEFNIFAHHLLNSIDTILFGRVTYELMANFWPGEFALRTDPVTAKLMNDKPKIVFSETLKKVDWQNTRLVQTDPIQEIMRLKKQDGRDMAIFGSSDLAVTLLRANLIDELLILVNPILLGSGKPLFQGLGQRVKLKLVDTKVLGSGVVILTYHPG